MVYVIDPYLEEIRCITAPSTLSSVASLVGARRITIAALQDNGDAAYCDAEALLEEQIPPAFLVKQTGTVVYGKGVWHAIEEDGSLISPSWLFEDLFLQIEFLGFVPMPNADFDPGFYADSGEDIPL